MKYESPPRIEWAPDGARMLVCRQGAIQLRTLDGAVVRELAQRGVRLGTAPRGGGVPGETVPAGYLDARWLGDGRIVAVDVFGMPVQFTMHGVQYGDPREHTGGATCVALDDRGIRAAYAYPDGIGEARLRIDYLAPAAKGPRAVEILETIWIEPGIGELCALAFEPAGHRIACLGEDGRVEIAPVP